MDSIETYSTISCFRADGPGTIRFAWPEMSWRRALGVAVAFCQLCFAFAGTNAQDPASPGTVRETPDDETPATPERVDVQPLADDEAIAARLTRILEATGWFENPQARVDEGVVFLAGRVDTQQHKEWAGTLATKTQDVVAVVNQIEVRPKSMWDLSESWNALTEMASETFRNLPLLLVGLLLLVLTWWATRWTVRLSTHLFQQRLPSPLLVDVVSRALAVPVFLLGVYLILKVSGLTRLAMTVIGGTGLAALVVGFAFRDIAENFLASVLISIQRPFAIGDLIEVAGYKGYLQSVNTRSALLMTLEGNHVQIPNATIYKETITNYTANPNARFEFLIGIGYDDSISKAQSIALQVLQDHPAVVTDPEPMILVESLGAATVNLRVYFWINIAEFSAFKVRSAVIRLTKRAFDRAGISMPDEAREVVFPAGVPVQMLGEEPAAGQFERTQKTVPEEGDAAANEAEGDLTTEADEINEQAKQARTPEAGQNLLEQ